MTVKVLAAAGAVTLLGAGCGGTLEGKYRRGEQGPGQTPDTRPDDESASLVRRAAAIFKSPRPGEPAAPADPAAPAPPAPSTTPPAPSDAEGPDNPAPGDAVEEDAAPAPAPAAPPAARAATAPRPQATGRAAPPPPAPKEVGVGTSIIKMGGTTVLSGPLAEYGRQELFGFDARVQRINDAGGINGRRLKLIVYDDGLDPARDRSLFRRLVESDGIFAATAAGSVAAIADYLCQQVPRAQGTPVPLVADVALLPEPQLASRHRCVFAAGPGTRHGAWIRARLATGLGAHTIGVIMTDHSLAEGRAAAAAEAKAVYEAEGLAVSGVERLELGAPSCDEQVRLTLGRNPDYLFLDLATPADLARCVSSMQRIGWKPRVATEVSAPVDAVTRVAGTFAEGFLSTSIFKPTDDPGPAMAEYRADLARYHPDADPAAPATLGSYLAAKVTEHLLRTAGEAPTRAGFLDAADRLRGWDSGLGPVLTWSPTERYGFKKTHLLKVTGGRFVPTGDVLESTCPEGACAP